MAEWITTSNLVPPGGTLRVAPNKAGRGYDVEQVVFGGYPIPGVLDVVPEALLAAKMIIAPEDVTAFTLRAAGIEMKQAAPEITGYLNRTLENGVSRASRALGAKGRRDFDVAHAVARAFDVGLFAVRPESQIPGRFPGDSFNLRRMLQQRLEQSGADYFTYIEKLSMGEQFVRPDSFPAIDPNKNAPWPPNAQAATATGSRTELMMVWQMQERLLALPPHDSE